MPTEVLRLLSFQFFFFPTLEFSPFFPSLSPQTSSTSLETGSRKNSYLGSYVTWWKRTTILFTVVQFLFLRKVSCLPLLTTLFTKDYVNVSRFNQFNV